MLNDDTPREPELNKLFRLTTKMNGTELYLRPGEPPRLRLRGELRSVIMRAATPDDMRRWVPGILNQREVDTLGTAGRMNLTYVVGKNECRFRVSVFQEADGLWLSARRLSSDHVFFGR